MRKKIVAGNWKMNKTLDEAMILTSEVVNMVRDEVRGEVEVVLCTPYIYLPVLQKYVEEVPESWNKAGRFVYTYAVVASLFLSSLNYSMILSTITGASAAISYYLWEAQFESTWCYFAALISSFIVFMVRCEVQAYPVGKVTKTN